MPKNRKPRGGRPARNFDPRYGEKKSTFRPGRGFARNEARGDAGREGQAEERRRSESGRGSAPRGRDAAESRGFVGRGREATSHATEKNRAVNEVSEDRVHGRLDATMVSASTNKSFADLGLGGNIVRVLAELGATSPFPIQAATIPAVLDGRDVLGRGRTGSGKTIAFGAPLVEAVLRSQAGSKREFGRAPRALILAPTRELALQLDDTIQPLARSVGLFTTQVYGGVPAARQVGALKKGVDIVIGTPGRVEDLIERGRFDLSDIRITVIDEADHMSELGFIEQVQRILRLVENAQGGRSSGQKLLFSATLDRQVNALVREFLRDPAVFAVEGETQETGTIEHRVLVVAHRDKPALLNKLVAAEKDRVIVFTRTRDYAEMLAEQFEQEGIRSITLHGDLGQSTRTRNLELFAEGRARVLVATDVAARGIHVDDIGLVIQADAPSDHKTYLHRAGRTGRAGRSGRVVTVIPRHREERMTELLARAEITAPFETARVSS